MNAAAKVAMVMAGGTGGHVFPALAVARQLQQDGYHIVWLGTRQGLEAKVVPQAGIHVEWIKISGLRGKGKISLLVAPFKLTLACWQAAMAILKWKPVLVLGMGGFVTGPGGFMAWVLRKPLLIHEQNAIAGLTNRILSKFAWRVMQAFPSAFRKPGVFITGNPVRVDIAAIAEPASRLGHRQGTLQLLVLGGSLGAKALNESVPRALSLLARELQPVVRHQTGHRNLDETLSHYSHAGIKAQVVPFIDDMAEALAWADLVICRAGALTLAEITAAGVASILVPFPFAVDDHQTANARYLSDAGAALLIQQADLRPQWLAEQITRFSQQRILLVSMAEKARALAKPDATRVVAAHCKEVALD